MFFPIESTSEPNSFASFRKDCAAAWLLEGNLDGSLDIGLSHKLITRPTDGSPDFDTPCLSFLHKTT